jgi:predicted O-methyltransferase YrrM
MRKNMFGQNPFEVRMPPTPTGDIKRKHVRDVLQELGMPVENIELGLFDEIGEVTARKKRSRDNELYKTAGAYFRPNYERGLLIYALIKHLKINSFLEIGFGRGYGTLCAAMAMSENGGGKISCVDPAFAEDHLRVLNQMFPPEWFSMMTFYQATSDDFFSQNHDQYDMIYIDGDHMYEGVLKDWNNAKARFSKVVLFDDYHLPSVQDPGIQVAAVVDAIDDFDKELVIMDRRIFYDDRGKTDDEINYGQVIVTPKGQQE